MGQGGRVMATWLYQTNQQQWPPERYRLEIWEGERWYWPVGQLTRGRQGAEDPVAGDTVVFFYARTGGSDPGFYGWAIITEWLDRNGERGMYFRPVSPSDELKMNPRWDPPASELADEIRGAVKQGTMWRVQEDLVPELRRGIRTWLRSAASQPFRGSVSKMQARSQCYWHSSQRTWIKGKTALWAAFCVR